MIDGTRRRLASLIAHPSLLARAAAVLYILHVLLECKVALGELFAFFSMFALGWAIAKREARFSAHILYFPLIVYGFASTLSAIVASRRIHGGYEGMLWFKMLIFPCAVILYRQVPRLRDLAVYAYVVFGGGMAVWGLLQWFVLGQRDLEHRISGPASHVMTFSGLILPVSLMFFILWRYQRKWWQLAVGALIGFALLLTFTRSAWLGWLAAVVVLLIASRVRIAIYALPVVILFVTFLPLSLFGRLISTFDLKQSSNFDRIRMVEAGMEMIKDYPLLGVGPANVKDAYALYRKQDAPRARPPHLHNNLVQLWAERGILGIAGYVLLIGLFVRECIRGWRGPNRMWAEVGIATAVSLGVAGLFEFNFGDTEVFFLLLNLMALVVVSLEQPGPSQNEAAPALVPS